MNLEIANKRHHFLFRKTCIASIVFMAAMIFFSYQVSYAQLDLPDNFSSSTSSRGSDDSDKSTNKTVTPSLIENGNVSIGSF
jgi:hypothetical protein